MSSENPDGAENQQERLIELRGWVIGFVDGEGCFSIGSVRQHDRPGRIGYRTGYQVSHEFAVTQGASSAESLHDLRRFFDVGQVLANTRYDNHREHLYRYVVRRREDLLERIIPFFRRHPMRTSKQQNFREVRRVRGAHGGRRSPDPGRSHRDRPDRRDNESAQAQNGPHQNPQRPYARHPRQWMKRWSRLHGDMQGRCLCKEGVVHSASRWVRL
jgi:LAGLIDADG endonuclease